GPLLLSGAIARGASIVAAQAMGADLAYIGSPFIATSEANAALSYKQMIVDSSAQDIVYSDFFTGVHGNYLRGSILASGLDPDDLPAPQVSKVDFVKLESGPKAWKDVWGCGQGIGAVDRVLSTAELVQRLSDEYASSGLQNCSLTQSWRQKLST
ncbi:MAG TPA: nitronate monooxygenase, partial [Burkholderiaceae bacterium]|nr:nitronate monooxygenase [Burkholderiaceae bacterium]